MSNKSYVKGSNYERERVKWHYSQGAIYSARIAGSHSPYDVVAVYQGAFGYNVYFEQLKSKKADAKHVLLPLKQNFFGGAIDGSSVSSNIVIRNKGGGWQVL